MKILGVILFFSLFIVRVLIFNTSSEKQIAYFIRPFDENEIAGSTSLPVTFPDSVIKDSIYLLLSEENIPLAYSCSIQTLVCNDKECLPVDITLFWETTGAYLGFKLPLGLPLTKKEHLPFSEEEYVKLNKLLSNHQSVLSNYKRKDLVVSGENLKEVDGVSSATVLEVRNVTVSGAVYTCYQLWQIVNGQIARFVSQHSSQIMTPAFASRLIKKDKPEEILWLLEQVNFKNTVYSELKQDMVQILTGHDYSVAYRILNILDVDDLNSVAIQHSLLDAFNSSSAALKTEIVKKLFMADELDEKLFNYFSENLSSFRSYLLIDCLQLLSKQNRVYPDVVDYVSGLLKSENKYLANKAWQFVNKTSSVSEKSQALVKRYRSKFK